MANAQKYTKSACGHMTAHYERAKDENGEYIKFGNQNIDPSRTHLNYNLAPLRVSDSVSGVSGLVTDTQSQMDFIRQRTTEARTLNRADVNVMVSWVVTLPKYQAVVTDPNIVHVSFDKERAEKLFFQRTYDFLVDRYGEKNVVSAYVHMDEVTPHMHFAFVPVTEDKKRGGEKVSAKQVVDRKDLQTFHTDLERYLDSFHDFHFEVVNEATKDGNKEVAELKKQTAHEEVLKAQQKAVEARQRVVMERGRIEPLQEKKKALEGEIEALQTEKEQLTKAEVEAIKGEKTLFGGLRGVSYKEFEALKRTAVKVESISAERDQALARAEQADQRATKAEAEVNHAYEDANRQLQEVKAKLQQPSLKLRQENAELRSENAKLKEDLSWWQKEAQRWREQAAWFRDKVKELAPAIYEAIIHPPRTKTQPTHEKTKTKNEHTR